MTEQATALTQIENLTNTEFEQLHTLSEMDLHKLWTRTRKLTEMVRKEQQKRWDLEEAMEAGKV
tara:strand:- start:23 stop:214 length:192 start_codon:yes stop_codon:yes gene_type:complete